MLYLSYLLLLSSLSYGLKNTTNEKKLSWASLRAETMPSTKEGDAANIILKKKSDPKEHVTAGTGDKALTGLSRCTELWLDEGVCVPYERCNKTGLFDALPAADIIDLLDN